MRDKQPCEETAGEEAFASLLRFHASTLKRGWKKGRPRHPAPVPLCPIHEVPLLGLLDAFDHPKCALEWLARRGKA